MDNLPKGRAMLSLLAVLTLSLASARAAETTGPKGPGAAPVVVAGPASTIPSVPAANLASLVPAQAALPAALPSAAAPSVAGPQAAPGLPGAAPAAPAAHAAPSALPAALPASIVAAPSKAASPAEPGGASGRDRAPSAREQAEGLGRVAGSSPEKGGFDAAFDGSAAARPGADDAFAVEAANDRHYDAATEFRRANPGSNAAEVLSMLGDFHLVANELVISDVFSQTRPGRHELDHIIPPYAPEGIRRAALEVLQFAGRSGSDPAAARFVRYLGRLSAQQQLSRMGFSGRDQEPLPANPLGRGEYWDLAAGPNGLRHMIAARDPRTVYKFFDYNDYVVAMLQEGKRLMAERGLPAGNVEVVKADVNELQRPAEPIAVLRNKNVHTYVPGFEKKLDTMTDWIAEGGVLLIENDPGPQRLGIVTKLRPMIERLISEGWTLRFGGFSHDGRGLETLTLTRPRHDQPKTRDAASARVWQEYMEEAYALEMHPAGINALLRAVFGR